MGVKVAHEREKDLRERKTEIWMQLRATQVSEHNREKDNEVQERDMEAETTEQVKV